MQIEAAMPDPFQGTDGTPWIRNKRNQEARGWNEGGAASKAAYYSTPSHEDESGMGADRHYS